MSVPNLYPYFKTFMAPSKKTGAIQFARYTGPADKPELAEIINASFSRPNVGATSGAIEYNSQGNFVELAENEPAWDKRDGGCPKLLLRPQATNLLPVSNDFHLSAWNKSGAIAPPVIDANVDQYSDGVLADRINFDGAGNQWVLEAVSLTAGETYYSKVDLKNDSVSSGLVRWNFSDGVTGGHFVSIDLTTMEVAGSAAGPWSNFSYKVIPLPNGYTRFCMQATSPVTGGGWVEFTNNSTTSGAFFAAEALVTDVESFDSIPTNGSALTRSTEQVILTDLVAKQMISAEEGAVLLKLNTEEVVRSSSAGLIQLGTIGNWVFVYNAVTSAARPQVRAQDSISVNTAQIVTDNSCVGITWDKSRVLVSVNGSTLATLDNQVDLSLNSNLSLSGANRPTQLESLAFGPNAISEAAINAFTANP